LTNPPKLAGGHDRINPPNYRAIFQPSEHTGYL
jgi:hypothetical protein